MYPVLLVTIPTLDLSLLLCIERFATVYSDYDLSVVLLEYIEFSFNVILSNIG